MLITDKYPSVVATRFRLRTKITKQVDGKDKQIWDINCPARINEGKKLQISSYIEEMNGIDCNIYYEIDEEATEKAQEYLRDKLAAKKDKEKNSNLSTNDAIGKLAEAINKGNAPKKEKKEEVKESLTFTFGEYSSDDMSLEDLQQYCKDNTIKFHHKSKRNKLISLIIENN